MTINNRFLFRVWDKGERKMLYEDLDAYCNSDKGMCLCDSNCVLMQCTGLTAAKSSRGESETDKLIFEGDIIKHQSKIGCIAYNHSLACYQLLRKRFVLHEKSITLLDSEEFKIWQHSSLEIIGNIWDNPELAEV